MITENDAAINVTSLITEGVQVFAVPISSNDIAYSLAEMACDTLAYTGDESLLEAYVNDNMYAFT